MRHQYAKLMQPVLNGLNVLRVCHVIWDKNKTAIKNLREAKSHANFFSDVVCFAYNTLVEISNSFYEKRRKKLILKWKEVLFKFPTYLSRVKFGLRQGII